MCWLDVEIQAANAVAQGTGSATWQTPWEEALSQTHGSTTRADARPTECFSTPTTPSPCSPSMVCPSQPTANPLPRFSGYQYAVDCEVARSTCCKLVCEFGCVSLARISTPHGWMNAISALTCSCFKSPSDSAPILLHDGPSPVHGSTFLPCSGP